jgi:hypothetical protein
MASEEVLIFHEEFAKYFSFDVPLDPKNLAMIIYPYWGYFCKFIGKEFTFDQLIEFYNNEFLSTHIRRLKRVYFILFITGNFV